MRRTLVALLCLVALPALAEKVFPTGGPGSFTANGSATVDTSGGYKIAEVQVWGPASVNASVTIYRNTAPDTPPISVNSGPVAVTANPGKSYIGPSGTGITVAVSSYVAGPVYWRVILK